MSADDFRDLVSEFDHSGVTDLQAWRWAAPDFVGGDIVPGTGGYAQITLTPPWAYIADAPQEFREQLPVGERERESVLLWQWSELLDGTPVNTLRTTQQSTHGKADRLFDVDRGKWFEVQKHGDFRAIAKVNAAICTLVDGDPL